MSPPSSNDRDLRSFELELGRLLQDSLRSGDFSGEAGSWQPRMDIAETETHILLLLEVPGCRAADLEVEVAGDSVRIRGAKEVKGVASGARFRCAERRKGRFARDVQLRWPVNTHRGEARLRNGLLTVSLPKIEEQRQRSRRLEITEGEEGRG